MVCADSDYVGADFGGDGVREDAAGVQRGAVPAGGGEAGFFPGIIVYFTHWFPLRDRARAMSGFIVAVPFSLALGAPVSALLLEVDWLGMAGWQWLFVLEGLPAVVLGVVTDRKSVV